MRTFLTYVLAVLAATVVFSAGELIRFVQSSDFAAALDAGDPQMISGGLASLFVTVLLDFLIGLAVVGLIWRALSTTLGRAVSVSIFSYISRGIGAHVLLAAISVAFLVAFGGVRGIDDLGVGVTELAGYLVIVLIAGVAWGTVFWMRAPKPENTGIAA